MGIAGQYLLHVRLRKQAVALPGSPFSLTVDPGPAYALSSTLPTEHIVGHVDECCEALLTTADKMGNRRVTGGETVTCECSAAGVRSEVHDLLDGRYRLQWFSPCTGTFAAHVMINGHAVNNSPCTIRFESTSPEISRTEMSGDGLSRATARQPTSVLMRFHDRHGNPVMPSVQFRNSVQFAIGLINEQDVSKAGGKASSGGNVQHIMRHARHPSEGCWLPSLDGYKLTYVPGASTGTHFLHVWMESSLVEHEAAGAEEMRRAPESVPGSPFIVMVERDEEAEDAPDKAVGGTAPADYVLDRMVFEDAQRRWGACSIDAFASEATALLPKFWTAKQAPGAAGTDAYQQEWPSGERIWAHPPSSALAAFVAFLQEPRRLAEVIVCTPKHVNHSWFNELVGLSDERQKIPAGKLQRVAKDAPERLEEWPCMLFHIPGR